MSMQKNAWTLILLFTTAVVWTMGSVPIHNLARLNRPANAAQAEQIVVNQVGYQPNWRKVAFWLNANTVDPGAVELVDLKTDQTVLSLEPGPPEVDQMSGDSIQTLDFSTLTRPGEYALKAGEIQSVPFQIGIEPYPATLVTLLRTYYLQRCGIELDDPVTGIYHPPCHIRDGLLAHDDLLHADLAFPQGEPIEAQGGWHDAGDYGKYVTTTTVAIGRLLSLYEHSPHLFWDDQLAIPESGNGVPDLLDEMQVGLDWLLRMQRPDGAVYRKLSGSQWPIGLAPDEDTQPRYIYGVATPETAKFAATMAMATRVYQSYQPKLAQTYLAAAEAAWQFLETQPMMRVDWMEGDDSGSGIYLFSDFDREESLTTDIDDRLWAAAELSITTGEAAYAHYFAQHLSDFEYTLFEWKDPSPLALTDYLLQTHQSGSETLKAQIKAKLLQRADDLLDKVANSGYHLANQRFIWGSNKMAAEEGVTLAYAYQITQNPIYRDAALDQLDYLLGRNPFNQTFVTDVGSRSVKHVNHLFTRARNIQIPGLLVGGPNADAQDGIAPKDQGILSYVDDSRSYATNEYAIDYNASLISLIGMLIG